MRLNRWTLRVGTAFVLPVGFLMAESVPQFVANPYYVPAPAVVNTRKPAATEQTADRNQVVYPSASTTAWNRSTANSTTSAAGNSAGTGNVASVAAASPSYSSENIEPTGTRSLPRDRVAALGLLVQVPTLSKAYRGSTGEAEIRKQFSESLSKPLSNLDRSVTVPAAPTVARAEARVEPSRLAPSMSSSPIPAPAPFAPAFNPAMASYRQDSAVRPVAWSSDVGTSNSQADNPLRAFEVKQRAAVVANPLR